MGTSARDTFVGSSFHYHEYKGDKEISMRLVMTRIKDQRLLLRSLFCPACCPAPWEPQLLMPRLTPSCWLPPLQLLTMLLLLMLMLSTSVRLRPRLKLMPRLTLSSSLLTPSPTLLLPWLLLPM